MQTDLHQLMHYVWTAIRRWIGAICVYPSATWFAADPRSLAPLPIRRRPAYPYSRPDRSPLATSTGSPYIRRMSGRRTSLATKSLSVLLAAALLLTAPGMTDVAQAVVNNDGKSSVTITGCPQGPQNCYQAPLQPSDGGGLPAILAATMQAAQQLFSVERVVTSPLSNSDRQAYLAAAVDGIKMATPHAAVSQMIADNGMVSNLTPESQREDQYLADQLGNAIGTNGANSASGALTFGTFNTPYSPGMFNPATNTSYFPGMNDPTYAAGVRYGQQVAAGQVQIDPASKKKLFEELDKLDKEPLLQQVGSWVNVTQQTLYNSARELNRFYEAALVQLINIENTINSAVHSIEEVQLGTQFAYPGGKRPSDAFGSPIARGITGLQMDLAKDQKTLTTLQAKLQMDQEALQGAAEDSISMYANAVSQDKKAINIVQARITAIQNQLGDGPNPVMMTVPDSKYGITQAKGLIGAEKAFNVYLTYLEGQKSQVQREAQALANNIQQVRQQFGSTFSYTSKDDKGQTVTKYEHFLTDAEYQQIAQYQFNQEKATALQELKDHQKASDSAANKVALNGQDPSQGLTNRQSIMLVLASIGGFGAPGGWLGDLSHAVGGLMAYLDGRLVNQTFRQANGVAQTSAKLSQTNEFGQANATYQAEYARISAQYDPQIQKAISRIKSNLSVKSFLALKQGLTGLQQRQTALKQIGPKIECVASGKCSMAELGSIKDSLLGRKSIGAPGQLLSGSEWIRAATGIAKADLYNGALQSFKPLQLNVIQPFYDAERDYQSAIQSRFSAMGDLNADYVAQMLASPAGSFDQQIARAVLDFHNVPYWDSTGNIIGSVQAWEDIMNPHVMNVNLESQVLQANQYQLSTTGQFASSLWANLDHGHQTEFVVGTAWDQYKNGFSISNPNTQAFALGAGTGLTNYTGPGAILGNLLGGVSALSLAIDNGTINSLADDPNGMWGGFSSVMKSYGSGWFTTGTFGIGSALKGGMLGASLVEAGSWISNAIRPVAEFMGIGGDAITALNLTKNFASIDAAVQMGISASDAAEILAMSARATPLIDNMPALNGWRALLTQPLDTLKSVGQMVFEDMPFSNAIGSLSSTISNGVLSGWSTIGKAYPDTAKFISAAIDAAAAAGRGTIRAFQTYLEYAIPTSVRLYAAGTGPSGSMTADGLMGALTAPVSMAMGAISYGAGLIAQSDVVRAAGLQGLLGNATVDAWIKNATDPFGRQGLTALSTAIDPNAVQAVTNSNGQSEVLQAGKGWSSAQKAMDNWAYSKGGLAVPLAWATKTLSTYGDVSAFGIGGKLTGTLAARLFGTNAFAEGLSSIAMQAPMVDMYRQQVNNFGELLDNKVTFSRYAYDLTSFAAGVGATRFNTSSAGDAAGSPAIAPEGNAFTATLKEAGKIAVMGVAGQVLGTDLTAYVGAFGFPVYQAANGVTEQQLNNLEVNITGQGRAAVDLLQMNLDAGERQGALGEISSNLTVTKVDDTYFVNGVEAPKELAPALKGVWDQQQSDGPTVLDLGSASRPEATATVDTKGEENAALEKRIQENSAELNQPLDTLLRTPAVSESGEPPAQVGTEEGSVLDHPQSFALQADASEGGVASDGGATSVVQTEHGVDPATQELMNKARDLRIRELSARIRGDAPEVAVLRAERGAMSAQLATLMSDKALRQIDAIRKQMLDGVALKDWQFAAEKKIAQEWMAERNRLSDELAAAKGDPSEVERVEQAIKDHEGKLENIPVEARQRALSTLDRVSAEQAVLADRAENLAAGNSDWSQSEIEKRIAVKMEEIQNQRRGSDQPIDKIDAMRDRVNRAYDEASAVRKAATERQNLFEEQARALREGERAKTYSERRALLNQSEQIGRKIREVDFRAQSESAAKIIESLRLKEAKDMLTPSEAYQIAKARYEKAFADYEIKTQSASRWEQARLIEKANAELPELQKVMNQALIKDRANQINETAKKLTASLVDQKAKIKVLKDQQAQLNKLFDQIDQRLNSNQELTRTELAKEKGKQDSNKLDDLAAERNALAKYAQSLTKTGRAGELPAAPSAIDEETVKALKNTELQELTRQRQAEEAKSNVAPLPTADPTVASLYVENARAEVAQFVDTSERAADATEAMRDMAAAQRDMVLAANPITRWLAQRDFESAQKSLISTIESKVDEAMARLDKNAQAILEKINRSPEEAVELATSVYKALKEIDPNFTFLGQDGEHFQLTAQFRGLVDLFSNQSFNLATSGGKTLIAALFAAKQDGQVVFVAPNAALAAQLENKTLSGGMTYKNIIESVGGKKIHNLDRLYSDYDSATGNRQGLYNALEDSNGVLLMSRETHGFLFLRTQNDGRLHDAWNLLKGRSPISLLTDEVQNLANPMSFIMSDASGKTLDFSSPSWIKAEAMWRVFNNSANFDEVIAGAVNPLARFWELNGSGKSAYWYDSQNQTVYLTDAAIDMIRNRTGKDLSTSDIVSFAKGWGQATWSESYTPVGAIVRDGKVMVIDDKGDVQPNMTYHDTIYAAAFALRAMGSAARPDMVPTSTTNMQVAESQAMDRYTTILGMTGTSEGVRTLLANKIAFDADNISSAPDRVLNADIKLYRRDESVDIEGVTGRLRDFLADPAKDLPDGRPGLRRGLVYGLTVEERMQFTRVLDRLGISYEEVNAAKLADPTGNLRLTGADYYDNGGKEPPPQVLILTDDSGIEGTDYRGEYRLVGDLSNLMINRKGASKYLQFINRVQRESNMGTFDAQRELWMKEENVDSALLRLAESPAQQNALKTGLWAGDRGTAKINGQTIDLKATLDKYMTTDGRDALKTQASADELAALGLNYVESRISTIGHEAEAREANARALELEALQARYREATAREQILKQVFDQTHTGLALDAYGQAKQWREDLEAAMQKAVNPESKDANYKPENKETVVGDNLQSNFERDRAAALKMWRNLRSKLPADGTYDATRAKINATIKELGGTDWKDVPADENMTAVKVRSVRDAIAYNKKLAKEMLPFESAELPSVSKAMKTAQDLINQLKFGNPAEGDSSGESPSVGGSSQDRINPNIPTGPGNREAGTEPVISGIAQSRIETPRSSGQQSSPRAQASPAPTSSNLTLGKVSLVPNTLMPSNAVSSSSQGRKSLSIAEIALARLQAQQAVRQAGAQVPPLVIALAATSSVQEAAQVIFRQAGVKTTSIVIGNINQWWKAASNGLIAGMLPDPVKAEQRPGLLMSAVGNARGVDVLPLLENQARTNSDAAVKALSIQAIEAISNKPAPNKQNVLDQLQRIRSIALNAPRNAVESGPGYKVSKVGTGYAMIIDESTPQALIKALQILHFASSSNTKVRIHLPTGTKTTDTIMRAAQMARAEARARGINTSHLITLTVEGSDPAPTMPFVPLGTIAAYFDQLFGETPTPTLDIVGLLDLVNQMEMKQSDLMKLMTEKKPSSKLVFKKAMAESQNMRTQLAVIQRRIMNAAPLLAEAVSLNLIQVPALVQELLKDLAKATDVKALKAAVDRYKAIPKDQMAELVKQYFGDQAAKAVMSGKMLKTVQIDYKAKLPEALMTEALESLKTGAFSGGKHAKGLLESAIAAAHRAIKENSELDAANLRRKIESAVNRLAPRQNKQAKKEFLKYVTPAIMGALNASLPANGVTAEFKAVIQKALEKAGVKKDSKEPVVLLVATDAMRDQVRLAANELGLYTGYPITEARYAEYEKDLASLQRQAVNAAKDQIPSYLKYRAAYATRSRVLQIGSSVVTLGVGAAVALGAISSGVGTVLIILASLPVTWPMLSSVMAAMRNGQSPMRSMMPQAQGSTMQWKGIGFVAGITVGVSILGTLIFGAPLAIGAAVMHSIVPIFAGGGVLSFLFGARSYVRAQKFAGVALTPVTPALSLNSNPNAVKVVGVLSLMSAAVIALTYAGVIAVMPAVLSLAIVVGAGALYLRSIKPPSASSPAHSASWLAQHYRLVSLIIGVPVIGLTFGAISTKGAEIGGLLASGRAVSTLTNPILGLIAAITVAALVYVGYLLNRHLKNQGTSLSAVLTNA